MCRRFLGKDTLGRRLTYLLRPNVSRPSHSVANLDTPPATDLGYSSQGDLEGDSDVILSDRELGSSIGSLPPAGLLPVPETTSASQVRPHGVDSDDDWSVVGDDLEADAELSGNEVDGQEIGQVADAILEEPGSDCPATEDGVDVTPRPNRMLYNEGVRSIRQTPLSRVWDRRPRNSSSPSRSPARRSLTARRSAIRHEPPRDRTVKSFHAFLFGDR